AKPISAACASSRSRWRRPITSRASASVSRCSPRPRAKFRRSGMGKKNETKASLLVELLTEELPPKSLATLSKVFADEIGNALVRNQLKQQAGDWKPLATPRRLAVLIPAVHAAGEDRLNEVTGPSVKAPPEAVAGFAKKQGVDVKSLETRETPKGP